MWTDRRVLIMGLGAFGGGVGVTRWLCEQGADVTVTDLRPADELQDAIEALGAVDCRFVFGQHHHNDFEQAETVVVNPAVPCPWDNPYLLTTLAAGGTLTTEIRILIEQVDRTRCIGLTGTAGKSTTAAMTHHLLEHAGLHTLIGGNIGGSLLGQLDDITTESWIVLELSSAQLHWLDADAHGWPGWSPAIAAITNIADNHLDWHGSVDHYIHSKETIFRYQQDGDVLLRGEAMPRTPLDLAVPGAHNQRNAALALAIAQKVTDTEPTALANTLQFFPGLPHRLCAIDRGPNPRFFNDSKSTTPEATVLAVESFKCPKRIHLIAGGYDKGVSLAAIASLAPTLAGCYLIGQTASTLAAQMPTDSEHCGTLEQAVQTALARMQTNDILLLSPGCASWDQFSDYRERGERFSDLVRHLTI
ncbi:MAG: UDP-N-acetylmuramoyl-L-alanine--D-glutamate ligase [Phycisphaerales bacterium]|nr:UDP-N-acetylmuramoyl-L-alanine--D-glutamate ligase [Phycisphaerales bacterium]